MDSNLVICRVLKEIPDSFLGVDGKTYPSCKPEDMITLPNSNAVPLQDRGVIKILNTLTTLTKKPEEKKEPEVIIKDTEGAPKRKAFEILEHGDPVEFFLDEFNKIHVGDREIGRLLIASNGCLLCQNNDGLPVGLFGDSGTGKSDAGKAAFHLLSDKYKLSGSHSDKYLFYSGAKKVLKEKTLYFIDELTVITEEQEAVIREAISNFRLGTKRGTVKNMEPIIVEIPPRLTFWFSKQDMALTLQLLNRLLKLNPDYSPSQDESVFKTQTDEGQSGIDVLEVTTNTMCLREMDEILKDLPPRKVKIPFIEGVAKTWRGNKSDRRAWKQFQDTIKAFTCIFQLQRQPDENGILIATRQDFENAKKVWKVIKSSHLYKVDNYGQEVLSAIETHGDETHPDPDYIGLAVARIPDKLGWNKGKVFRVIHGGMDNKDQERGLLKLSFFKLEKGTRTIDHMGGKRTIEYDIAYVKRGWLSLYSFEDIATFPE